MTYLALHVLKTLVCGAVRGAKWAPGHCSRSNAKALSVVLKGHKRSCCYNKQYNHGRVRCVQVRRYKKPARRWRWRSNHSDSSEVDLLIKNVFTSHGRQSTDLHSWQPCSCFHRNGKTSLSSQVRHMRVKQQCIHYFRCVRSKPRRTHFPPVEGASVPQMWRWSSGTRSSYALHAPCGAEAPTVTSERRVTEVTRLVLC